MSIRLISLERESDWFRLSEVSGPANHLWPVGHHQATKHYCLGIFSGWGVSISSSRSVLAWVWGAYWILLLAHPVALWKSVNE